eukprot:gene4736-5792_t
MAKQRMLVEKQHVGATDLEPGGRFEGRPGEYALGLFNFYHCSRCDNPYLGGARQCGPAAGGGDPPQAAEQDANGARARNGGEEQPYRKEDLVGTLDRVEHMHTQLSLKAPHFMQVYPRD